MVKPRWSWEQVLQPRQACKEGRVQSRCEARQALVCAWLRMEQAQAVGRYRPMKERRTGVQVKEEDLEVQMREKISVIKIKKQD